MWNFRRINFISVVSAQKYIAFTGSGGKTSLMEHVADELLKQNRTVAITTTTKIYAKAPYHLLENAPYVPDGRRFIRVGKSIENGKLTAIGFEDIETLGSIFDVVLIEADGAKGMPLKFPAIHEPVIPPFCGKVIVLCGLDGFHEKVNEAVFRWELFCEATGISSDTLIIPQVFLRFFADDVLLKGVDAEKCTIVLNKYDAMGERREAIETGKDIIAGTGIERLVISSVLLKVFYEIEALNL